MAQISSRDGGMPSEPPPDQAEDGAGTETGDKAAVAGESDPTVQTGDSLGGEDAAGKSGGKKEAKTPEQRAERLKAAVQPQVDAISADPSLKKGNPCQAGVLDTHPDINDIYWPQYARCS